MINKVDTYSGTYFIYDFIQTSGEKKRIYAKSENELQQSIDRVKKEEQLYLSICRPKAENLLECIISCIDNFSLSGVPKVKTQQLKVLFCSLNHKCLKKSIYDVEVTEVQRMFNDLSTLYSDKTVEYLYTVVKNIFRVYDAKPIEIQLVPYSPCDTEVIMLPTEYELMIEFCKRNSKFGKKREIILFSLLTGLPFSFLLDIKKENVNLTSSRIEKNNNMYFLNSKAKQWIYETFDDYQESDYLFANEKNELLNLPIICQTVNRIVEYLCLPCKIKGKTLQKSFPIWCKYCNVTTESALIEKLGYSLKELSLIENEYHKRKDLFS